MTERDPRGQGPSVPRVQGNHSFPTKGKMWVFSFLIFLSLSLVLVQTFHQSEAGLIRGL